MGQDNSTRHNIGDETIYLHNAKLKQGALQFTDATNAQRLMIKYGTDIRYNALWKKWIVWNGKHWEMDEGALIHEKGLAMIRCIYDELLDTQDYRDRMEIEKFAIQSEATRRRKAFIEAATWIKELNIKSDDLDNNPWLLNVKNGVVDLTTNEFREHRQADMITKMANVEYNPQADCPAWKQFLLVIMNYNAELVNFLQTAAGWGITGDTSEQVMFMLHGSGANGKSTFLNAIMNILGDYATTTPTETFMKHKSARRAVLPIALLPAFLTKIGIRQPNTKNVTISRVVLCARDWRGA